MAVTSNISKARLGLMFDDGYSGDKQRFVKRSYAIVNLAAADEDIYDTAKAIESLQTKQLMHVIKEVDNDIVEI